MSTVGVRELKSNTSAILNAVREEKARYTVTYRGEPIAVILPIEQAPSDEQTQDEIWEELLRLGEEIFADWSSDKTASQLITEMRR